jgi:S-adenosylmethionine decarboxylase
MKKAPWGFMLSLDCAGCHPHLIRSKNNIIAFSNKLVKEIDMKPYGEPMVHHFGEGNKAGWSLVQLIHTSNFTAHLCEEDNSMYFDLFSCKPYNINTVMRVVDDYFKPSNMKTNYFERNARELE